jgi:hypothetical protein
VVLLWSWIEGFGSIIIEIWKLGMESKELSTEQTENEIIEERSSKANNAVVRRYAKKKFLGKGGFARCYEV